MYHITYTLKRSHHCCGCGHAYLRSTPRARGWGLRFRHRHTTSTAIFCLWKSTLCIIPGIGCSSSVEGKIPCTIIFITDQCRSQKALHVDSGSSFLVKVWACTVVMGGQNAFDMIPIDITKLLTLLIPFQLISKATPLFLHALCQGSIIKKLQYCNYLMLTKRCGPSIDRDGFKILILIHIDTVKYCLYNCPPLMY